MAMLKLQLYVQFLKTRGTSNEKLMTVLIILQINFYFDEYSSRAGTLSTLRFGERVRQMQNKAVVNEITEDDVNDLSDQIRQLKVQLF